MTGYVSKQDQETYEKYQDSIKKIRWREDICSFIDERGKKVNPVSLGDPFTSRDGGLNHLSIVVSAVEIGANAYSQEKLGWAVQLHKIKED